MSNFLNAPRTVLNQKVAVFSGEGAYHGSSKSKGKKKIVPEIDENRPTTIIQYLKDNKKSFDDFDAVFQNLSEVKEILPIPSQEEIKNDSVTFVWAPIEVALQEAGPVTRHVLTRMLPFLERKKKFVYIDSKIQYFEKGNLPVDSKLWHIDGSIAIRDERSLSFGHQLLHDMKARMIGDCAPKYLAYQSSTHCATQFASQPLSIRVPECIPSFDILDKLVKSANPETMSQPAASIVSFNGYSLHRAVPASADGWRLWIRCMETDREINIDDSIINCYNTVYKTS